MSICEYCGCEVISDMCYCDAIEMARIKQQDASRQRGKKRKVRRREKFASERRDGVTGSDSKSKEKS